jgi:hypothetical protein
MATTTISDFVIWARHIHGDARLAEAIVEMRAGGTIDLRVGGVAGTWRKMDDGKDGRATPGIRPLGKTQAFWRGLYKTRRGDVVTLEFEEGSASVGVTDVASPALVALAAERALRRTDLERQVALHALLDGAAQGWRSEARTLTRDEMHER